MAWFPLFIDLEGKKCLVAGGGPVARRKAQTLSSYGAKVVMAAPEEVCGLDVSGLRRKVEPEDVRDCALVVDATGDRETGLALAALCREERIPLNVVDTPDLCSAIFPAVLRRGRLTAAVSTGGASPIAAAWARDQLGEILPERFDGILEQMASLRPWAKAGIPDQPRRGAFLRRCFEAAVEKGAPLSEAEVGAYWTQEAEE